MEITNTPGLLESELLNENKENFEIIDDDKEIEGIVKALSNETRRRILQYIRYGPKYVSNIASGLKMTEANISAQIKKLEDAQLISCDYCCGHHGKRKISKLKANKILICF